MSARVPGVRDNLVGTLMVAEFAAADLAVRHRAGVGVVGERSADVVEAPTSAATVPVTRTEQTGSFADC